MPYESDWVLFIILHFSSNSPRRHDDLIEIHIQVSPAVRRVVAGAGVVALGLTRLGGPARVLVHADALVLVLKPSEEVTGVLAGPRAP